MSKDTIWFSTLNELTESLNTWKCYHCYIFSCCSSTSTWPVLAITHYPKKKPRSHFSNYKLNIIALWNDLMKKYCSVISLLQLKQHMVLATPRSWVWFSGNVWTDKIYNLNGHWIKSSVKCIKEKCIYKCSLTTCIHFCCYMQNFKTSGFNFCLDEPSGPWTHCNNLMIE